MIHTDLREIKPGEALTAEDWNALVRTVRELANESNARDLTVGDGLELKKSSSGSTLLLDIGNFRDDAEGYKHPFEVAASFPEDKPGTLRIRVAKGSYANYYRATSPDNFAAIEEEIAAADYDVELSEARKIPVFLVCPVEPYDAGGTVIFKPVGRCEITTEFPSGDYRALALAYVTADPASRAVRVEQRWRSDVCLL